MESIKQPLNLKYEKRGDETLYSTLLVYKYLGVSSHHKMKSKIEKLGLSLVQDEQLGSSINHEDLLTLLKSYELTLKGENQTRVGVLLKRLTQGTTQANVETSSGLVQRTTPRVHLNGKKSALGPTNRRLKTSPKTDPGTSPEGLPKTRWYEQALSTLGHFVQVLSTFIKTEQFIFIVLSGALIIQVNHVAGLFIRAAGSSTPLAWISAYLYGTVAELTALLLTIHRGKQSILRTFAFLTFWVNLLYYQVWLNFSPSLEWFTLLLVKVTLSAFLAYVIYSYTHLFTQKLFKN